MNDINQILATKKAWQKTEKKRSERALRSVENSINLPKKKDILFPVEEIVGGMLLFLGIVGILIAFSLIASSCVHAANIKDSEAVLAIIGEAEDQGKTGMLAVACGIRNRGTLQGVYGLNSYRVRNGLYSTDVKTDASNAWLKSKNTTNCQFIKGASHWESTDFKKPSWAKKELFRYKKHVFYGVV